ncbi:hypothetical protein GGI17_002639 [Coemansia sp. S146]|nr:hypothetical protein GGI17_002639 [Coemansia sp. S146]
MVLELLWCSLRKHLTEDAFVDLPTGKMSHLSHGNSVVITTSSSDYLPDVRAALDLFSTATGISFDLRKTKALFIGHNFGTAPFVPCAEFPITPLVDGEVCKYLGIYFNNILGKSGRGRKGYDINYDALISMELTELLTSADKITRGFTDHNSRTRALDTFITLRLRHLFEFMPVTLWTCSNVTERLKELVRSYSYQLPVADDEAALEACTGIYSFVNFDGTYYTIQLEQIRIAAMNFHRLAYPGHDGPVVPT